MQGWLQSKRELKLYCFSPPVMLATFIIEIALAIFVIFKYKLNEVGKLAVATLVLLAVFQLAEYNVCAAGWIDAMWASRIGYVAITILPALGIHLAYSLAGEKYRPLVVPAYLSAAAFAAFFLFVGLSGHSCLGNYAIFQVAPGASWLYSLYYYGWILVGIWLCARLGSAKTQTTLYGLGFGYLAFLLPTATANLLNLETISGIPSIMCGFAVLYAIVLVAWILPNAMPKKSRRW